MKEAVAPIAARCRLALVAALLAALPLSSCKRDSSAPPAAPSNAAAAAALAPRTLEGTYRVPVPFARLNVGDTVRYPEFALTYRGWAPGVSGSIARRLFTTTTADGQPLELPVRADSGATATLAGGVYELKVAGDLLIVTRAPRP